MKLFIAAEWRGTAPFSLLEGPSTRALKFASDLLSVGRRFKVITYTLMVYYFNDCCETAAERSMGKEHHAPNLDHPPLRGLDLDFCHGGCIFV